MGQILTQLVNLINEEMVHCLSSLVAPYRGNPINEERDKMAKRIGVLGGGSSGITTALALQEEFPNAEVTICAELLGAETSSALGQAAFIPPQQGHEEILKGSWDYFRTLNRNICPKNHGVFELPCFLLSTKRAQENGFLAKYAKVYRPCTKRELDLFQPRDAWESGVYSHTYMIDTKIFLEFGLNKFTSKGGRLDRRRINDFTEFQSMNYDLLVNCTGAGARKLCQDPSVEIKPTSFMKVEAPWVKLAISTECGLSIYPGMSNVLLAQRGGNPGYGWKKACSVLPSLTKSSKIQETVLWRSSRPSFRLEYENIHNLKVIHNYGHGNFGVILGPGCGQEVASLAKQILDPKSSARL
eukprot:maker-scaffold1456_size40526-snap-gene-0.9 protein:Tk07780 transcript:maker-scaffold1456_size40526-snap-gene-0.9-mRNA-1 annotation:"d-aspartate oxidase-like"